MRFFTWLPIDHPTCTRLVRLDVLQGQGYRDPLQVADDLRASLERSPVDKIKLLLVGLGAKMLYDKNAPMYAVRRSEAIFRFCCILFSEVQDLPIESLVLDVETALDYWDLKGDARKQAIVKTDAIVSSMPEALANTFAPPFQSSAHRTRVVRLNRLLRFQFEQIIGRSIYEPFKGYFPEADYGNYYSGAGDHRDLNGWLTPYSYCLGSYGSPVCYFRRGSYHKEPITALREHLKSVRCSPREKVYPWVSLPTWSRGLGDTSTYWVRLVDSIEAHGIDTCFLWFAKNRISKEDIKILDLYT